MTTTGRSMIIAAMTWAALASGQSPAQPAQPQRLQSPEIRANGNTTFRVRAPDADRVRLASSGDIPAVPFGGGLDMTRGDDGVWTLTLEGLDAGAYRYNFDVDGVATVDPSNPLTSQSNANSWSLFYVPGADFMDTRDVPHGAVAEVYYESSVLGSTRRMHVYTPPGYHRGNDRYPVFYLLHGAMDNDDSWSTVGRAGFIIDNLIAAGRAEPMIVVMPDGHTRAFRMGAGGLPLDEFVREFAADIKPYVEANYRVQTGRDATAIAGLSMGGAHTLEIAVRDLEEYGYIGVFSSGVFSIRDGTDWPEQHAGVLGDASLRRGLELVWFSTGSDDFLLDVTEGTVAMLDAHGFDVTYEESAGGHTWINWREYLADFASLLFR